MFCSRRDAAGLHGTRKKTYFIQEKLIFYIRKIICLTKNIFFLLQKRVLYKKTFFNIKEAYWGDLMRRHPHPHPTIVPSHTHTPTPQPSTHRHKHHHNHHHNHPRCALGVVSSVCIWPLPIRLNIGCSGVCSARRQLIFEKRICESLGAAVYL